MRKWGDVCIGQGTTGQDRLCKALCFLDTSTVRTVPTVLLVSEQLGSVVLAVNVTQILTSALAKTSAMQISLTVWVLDGS